MEVKCLIYGFSVCDSEELRRLRSINTSFGLQSFYKVFITFAFNTNSVLVDYTIHHKRRRVAWHQPLRVGGGGKAS